MNETANAQPRDDFAGFPLMAHPSLSQGDIDRLRQIRERVRFVLEAWATETPQESSATRRYDRSKSPAYGRFMIDTLRKVIKYGCDRVPIPDAEYPRGGESPSYPVGDFLLVGSVSPSSRI